MRFAAILFVPVVLASTAIAQAAPSAAPAPATCADSRADDRATLVSVVVHDDLRHLGSAVDTVLAELGYRISGTESGIGQWVTVARFGWPAGSAQDAWHGVDQPGVQIVVDLSPDSGGTRLSIAAGAVCRVSADAAGEQRSASVENTIETVSAMEVATALARHLEEQRKLRKP
ncbi:MAG: hypothetical protein H0U85_06780 [Gemmatimonadales bacterium]|nr:hypothetical protein [Gemmatimonadales bacterium]